VDEQTKLSKSPPSRRQYVICLAGHIDHGKSALVRALTGGTVDRLPEEKRRGITIELGFSHFDDDGCRFALVDVPGHERFIHTMVAGASGVDAALLVIAADDSVMPQTREHLALLELLGVQRGVVAISKCDLADEEQLEMVELEAAELVAPTFLAGAPRIRVSTVASQGISELRQALIEAARSSPARATSDPRFRLPIDRAFSPAGQGAVVTGTVWRGQVRVGDTLHLLPQATPVRIRRLQSQGADVDCISAGERAAINLAGVKATAIRRGDELASPEAFVPARRHVVELRILADAGHALKHRQLVRLHLGANQVTAQVLMGQREAAPGQMAFAVVRCAAPIVAEYGQPFVLRQLSPASTIGGGRIIGPALKPTDRLNRCLAAAPSLASADAQSRLAAFIDLRREASLDAASESWVGLTPQECERVVERLIERKEVVLTAGSPPRLVSARRFNRLKERMLYYCRTELERRRPASQVPLSVILSAMSRHASEPVLQSLLEAMTSGQELVRRGDRVGFSTGPELSHRQRNVLNAVLAEISSAGATPPTLKELAEQHAYPLKDLEPLVQVAVDEGRLVRISPLLALDREALESLRQSLADYFETHPTGTVSEIREIWHMTRKHAVPVLEFFDQCQITQRAGDNRSAGPRIAQSAVEAPS
jgi:selenocysteine-specific elongation factor